MLDPEIHSTKVLKLSLKLKFHGFRKCKEEGHMASDCTLPDVCRLVHGGVKDEGSIFYADPYPRLALININFLA